ncbi:hypothetical protein BRADI_3g07506v3 [Brachypodium distachyon]|uniref:Uncharacterized protein n=1 Tax=Brachypodium distachyon TaxID=15368 RepID=A0A2K2CVS0_BRADI|nr:hypothetical protein BRADI_3g07506v3 [Brachypodium distachyon]
MEDQYFEESVAVEPRRFGCSGHAAPPLQPLLLRTAPTTLMMSTTPASCFLPWWGRGSDVWGRARARSMRGGGGGGRGVD